MNLNTLFLHQIALKTMKIVHFYCKNVLCTIVRCTLFISATLDNVHKDLIVTLLLLGGKNQELNFHLYDLVALELPQSGLKFLGLPTCFRAIAEIAALSSQRLVSILLEVSHAQRNLSGSGHFHLKILLRKEWLEYLQWIWSPAFQAQTIWSSNHFVHSYTGVFLCLAAD